MKLRNLPVSQSCQMAEQEFQSRSDPIHPHNLGQAHTGLRKFWEFPNTGTHTKTTYILTYTPVHKDTLTCTLKYMHGVTVSRKLSKRVSTVVLPRGYPQLSAA